MNEDAVLKSPDSVIADLAAEIVEAVEEKSLRLSHQVLRMLLIY